MAHSGEGSGTMKLQNATGVCNMGHKYQANRIRCTGQT